MEFNYIAPAKSIQQTSDALKMRLDQIPTVADLDK